MYLSAAMRRPLRSKRAMISPVRLRANASGLTRMRVLSTGLLDSGLRFRAPVAARGRIRGDAPTLAAAGGDLRATLPRATLLTRRRRRLGGRHGLLRRRAAAPAAPGGG